MEEHTDDSLSVTNAPAARMQRAELQRIAFGRTHGREDEEAAAAARQQLADADGEATAAVGYVASSSEVATDRRNAVSPAADGEEWAAARGVPAAMTTAPNDDAPPPPEPPQRGRRSRHIRAAWLIPIIAGSLAVGYIAAPNVAVQSLVGPSASTPPRVAPSAAPGVPSAFPIPNGELATGGPSSLKEADAWFETVPTERDGFGDPQLLETLKIAPSAVRFVQINAAGFQVWVAKTLNDDLCVLSTNGTSEISSACTPRAAFSGAGVMLTQSDYSIGWSGSRVTVSTPRLQLTR
ncbi:hypothetical protein GCM10027052_30110 [Parafrigoribacterium mesophilum]|uniref:hypothetical protein n=1 Tax=Parafrigoribacterium mesophilum TaxID=433646 RepID=UPI0031FE1D94